MKRSKESSKDKLTELKQFGDQSLKVLLVTSKNSSKISKIQLKVLLRLSKATHKELLKSSKVPSVVS